MKFQVGGGVLAPNIWVGESIIGLFDFCLFVCLFVFTHYGYIPMFTNYTLAHCMRVYDDN